MSKQRCEQIARKHGASISEGDGMVALEAPFGKTLDGTTHEYVYYFEIGDKHGAWADMLSDLRFFTREGGFYECELRASKEYCDWCDGESVGA